MLCSNHHAMADRGLILPEQFAKALAIRKLAAEAADSGLLAPELAAGIARVKGAKTVGVRMGSWLSARQAQSLLNAPSVTTLRGLRDRAILAVLTRLRAAAIRGGGADVRALERCSTRSRSRMRSRRLMPRASSMKRYLISAEAPVEAPSSAQVRLMLQALLAERFNLKLRRESKDLPVYEVTVGKNGPKMKEVAPDGPATVPPVFKGTMEHILIMLRGPLERPLIDKTGLAGTYEYTFDMRKLENAQGSRLDQSGRLVRRTHRGDSRATRAETHLWKYG